MSDDAESHIRSIVSHDGAVILDIKNDLFYAANPSGAFIWSHLRSGEHPEQIASALAQETGTDLAIVMRDVETFIEDLKTKRLFDFH